MKQKFRDFKAWFKGLFTDSQWGAIKEVSRWVVFLIISDIAVQLSNQAIKVPESLNLRVWEFTYSIPARMLFTTGLTLLLRYLDKLKHLNFKTEHSRSEKTGGLLPF